MISYGQQEVPGEWVYKMNRSKDSIQLPSQRKNSLLTVRNAARTEQKHILLFTSRAKTTRDQDALYLGALDKKDIYKINTTALVSKFMGEAEKNIDRLFAHASANNSILFFDEASQLFSSSKDPGATVKYIERLAREKNVLTLFWCEEDCVTWFKNSKYLLAQ